MPVLMEIGVTPVGKDGAGQGDVVVETLKVLEAEGIPYVLGPMGTAIEGELPALLEIARRMHEVCFRLGYPRVVTTLRIDDRRDKDLTMAYKVESVKRKLAEQATHVRES